MRLTLLLNSWFTRAFNNGRVFSFYFPPVYLRFVLQARLAQLVEHFFDVERVRGSSPLLRTDFLQNSNTVIPF